MPTALPIRIGDLQRRKRPAMTQVEWQGGISMRGNARGVAVVAEIINTVRPATVGERKWWSKWFNDGNQGGVEYEITVPWTGTPVPVIWTRFVWNMTQANGLELRATLLELSGTDT